MNIEDLKIKKIIYINRKFVNQQILQYLYLNKAL